MFIGTIETNCVKSTLVNHASKQQVELISEIDLNSNRGFVSETALLPSAKSKVRFTPQLDAYWG